jgi:hypothetical protein
VNGVPRTIHTSDDLRAHAGTEVRDLPDDATFVARFAELLSTAADRVTSRWGFHSVSPDPPAWLETGLELHPGDWVTMFATGHLLPLPGVTRPTPEQTLWYEAAGRSELRRGVWFRIGDDPRPRRGTRTSHTFRAETGGRLLLAATPITELVASKSDGVGHDTAMLPRVERRVLVVPWNGDAREGLAVLRAAGDVAGLIQSEIARFETRIELPDGWYYPRGGESEQFTADLRIPDAPIIGCYSRSGGALLKKDARLPLTPSTRLRWTWRFQQLAAAVPEDELHAHDYLSIAVQFDNGRDMTYCWSGALPVETAYRCPVPGWEDRELHVVVRSGTGRIGEWVDEERDIWADYASAFGDPPGNIVGVWLLASTQRLPSESQCDYGRIELVDGPLVARLN